MQPYASQHCWGALTEKPLRAKLEGLEMKREMP